MNLAFKAPQLVNKVLEWEFCGPMLAWSWDARCFTGGGGGAPAAPDFGTETQEELAAKTAAAPQVFGAESQFDPQYANLNLSDLSDTLLGTPGGTRTTPVTTNTPGFRNTVTGAFSTTPPPAFPSGFGGSSTGRIGGGDVGQQGQWVPFTEQGTTDQTISTPASPGYLNLLGQVNQVTNQQATESQAQQASGNIANLNTYGTSGVSALMAADPANASLISSMTDEAQQGLDAGTNLTPAQMRQVTQTVRQGQADRGLGFGPMDQYGEALGVSQYGTQLQQQRLGNAQSVANQRYTMYGGPATNMITNAPNNYSANALSQGYGISSAVGPKLFGSDLNAQDSFDTATNQAASQANAKANNSAALTSSGISAGTGIASAALLALALA